MAGKPTKAKSDTLEFHYQKSPQYRTIHADGAHGGPTARGYLAVTFYNERSTIPRRGSRTVEMGENGEPIGLGPEAVEEGLEGVMRQLEATVLLDLNAARELASWLVRHVAQLEGLMGVPDDQRFVAGKAQDDA